MYIYAYTDKSIQRTHVGVYMGEDVCVCVCGCVCVHARSQALNTC